MYTYFTKDSVFQQSRQKTPLGCFTRTFTNTFKYFSTSFMPAKITSSHCGREREPRRKTKTKPTKNANSHCRWKLILTNEKQCQEIYTLLTVLVFYRPRITETYRHGETGEEETKLQKILLESTLEVENILQLFFCISLGWTSNRA